MMAAAPWGRNTGDPTGNALQIRGQQAWQNGQQQRVQDWYQGGGSRVGAPAPITNVIPDSNWSALLQALHEQGADELTTSASNRGGHIGDDGSRHLPQAAPDASEAQRRAIGDAPGFFDLQDPRAQERQALMYQLRVQDSNRSGR